MNYYLEIWLRGFAKDHLRSLSIKDEESYHPHITLVRPFKILANEEDVKNEVTNFCKKKELIPFTLEGEANFNGNINYIPVINSEKLLIFNNNLEQLLNNKVQFAEKLDDKKILHATVGMGTKVPSAPKIDQYMLRLTGIKDKKIWFSYDFITREMLSREESLDKQKWYQTIHKFSKDYKLLPTKEGYKKL